jgi:DNA primase
MVVTANALDCEASTLQLLYGDFFRQIHEPEPPVIPETELTDLKARVPLLDYLRAQGLELRRMGKDFQALCPFHDEGTPSFTVTPAKNLFHCFGCGKGGDIFRYVMMTEGLSFPAAVRKIREYGNGRPAELRAVAGDDRPVYDAPAMSGEPRELRIVSSAKTQDNGASEDRAPASRAKETPKDLTDPELQKAAQRVFAYYERAFANEPAAREYLTERGITGDLSVLRIGYADGSLKDALPLKDTDDGRRIRRALCDIGILSGRGGAREHFAGCVVFALTDDRGLIRQIYGRRIKRAKIVHLYLPGEQRGSLFPAAFRSDELILTESVLDALSLYGLGFANVACTFSATSVPADVERAIRAGGVRRLVIAFDADPAGDRGAAQLIERFADLECVRIQLPRGSDVNDLVRVESDPVERFRALLAAANSESTPAGAAETPVTSATAANTEPADEPEEPAPGDYNAEKDTLWLANGSRNYRAVGIARNKTIGTMGITLAVESAGRAHLDRLDLCIARDRDRFTARAAGELQTDEATIKADLRTLVARLGRLQEEALLEATKPKAPPARVLTDEERREALELLQDSNIEKRLCADFERCGLVGEQTNALAAYFAATSRLLGDPLHVLIQSSSAAGKTTLMKAILALMPEESVLWYSALTGQSLFYMQDKDLRHRIVAIEEEEGAVRARYILKMLQTEGKANIATTLRDPQTGELKASEHGIEGPITTFQTTTATEIDDEIINRYLILATDESAAQTKLILEFQRLMETPEGRRLRHERKRIRAVHQNAQCLLSRMEVLIPGARDLTFLSGGHRVRRDHMKYLALIRAVALFRQFQKPKESDEYGEYIRADERDITIARRIAEQVFARGLDDMPPHTRAFLGHVEELVRELCEADKRAPTDCYFTARQIRERTGLSQTQVHHHLTRLVELEYLVCRREKSAFAYALLYAASPEGYYVPAL